jgi:NNP family nitrate/nitrite transporter-like MFS transporter
VIPGTPRARWLVLANVVAMNFFATGMAWTYVVVLVAPILEDLGLALRDWGAVWSAVSLGALVASIPAGALGDRFGARRTVALGALAMAAALGLRAGATSLPALLVAMALFGVTLAGVATNLPKALGTWFPRAELGLANGFALGGNGAGQGLATWLAPVVAVQLGGWRGLTAGIAAAVGALALFWLSSVRDPAVEPGRAAEPAGSWLAGLRRVLAIRDVWLLAASYFFFLAGYIGIVGYLPTYLVSMQGFTPARAGAMLSVVLAAYVVGSLVLPPLSDRIGLRRRVYIPGVLVCAVMVVACAELVGWPLLFALALWGFAAGGIALVFVVPLELESVGPALAGSAVGAVLSAGFLGGFVSPLVGLALAERAPLAAFAFFAGCYAASALCFALLPETGKRR